MKKKELWDRISVVVQQNSDCLVCVDGDFNAIKCANERRGRSHNHNRREMEMFDDFIR